MNNEIIAVIITFLLTVLIAIPLGKYMSKIFKDEKVFTDFLAPVERFIFRMSGVNPKEPMDWKLAWHVANQNDNSRHGAVFNRAPDKLHCFGDCRWNIADQLIDAFRKQF